MSLSGTFWAVARELICDCLECSGWSLGCCYVIVWCCYVVVCGVLGGC